MLETKYAGDNYKLLVTVLIIFVNNIHFLSSVEHQNSKDETNIEI